VDAEMNYVVLEIDTKKPELEIYAPSYTTREVIDEVTIVADETLDAQYEIYTIDINGDRRDYTFDHQGNQLVGLMAFNDYPLGTLTLYVQVRDEVHNLSNIYSKPIVVKESLSLLQLDIKDTERILKTSDTVRRMNINDKDRSVR
jgi:hypothetical protein